MKKGRPNSTAWLAAIFGMVLAGSVYGQSIANPVKISGRVTDFKNQPIEKAVVELKDSHFETAARAITDKDGRYSLTAEKGCYMGLMAVKDYQTRYLEYWAWSVPAERDLEINPRFDRLEVYAVNAWRPQGGYPSYQIYFRPMSLTRIFKKITEAGGMANFQKRPLLDIAPDLSAKDITVTIDGQAVKILRVNKVREAAGPDQDLFGYVIQTELPEKKAEGEYSLITIILTDAETDEMGEASFFYQPAPLR
jgi:hypothetical protein